MVPSATFLANRQVTYCLLKSHTKNEEDDDDFDFYTALTKGFSKLGVLVVIIRSNLAAVGGGEERGPGAEPLRHPRGDCLGVYLELHGTY